MKKSHIIDITIEKDQEIIIKKREIGIVIFKTNKEGINSLVMI